MGLGRSASECSKAPTVRKPMVIMPQVNSMPSVQGPMMISVAAVMTKTAMTSETAVKNQPSAPVGRRRAPTENHTLARITPSPITAPGAPAAGRSDRPAGLDVLHADGYISPASLRYLTLPGWKGAMAGVESVLAVAVFLIRRCDLFLKASIWVCSALVTA